MPSMPYGENPVSFTFVGYCVFARPFVSFSRKRLVDDDGDQHDDGKEYELPIVGL